MTKILIAGATGYLGKAILLELKNQGYWTRVLVRSEKQKLDLQSISDEVFVGQITQAETLQGICNDINIVFSSIGITRQRDGLTYEDVDYKGNLNLLKESERSGVRDFYYTSVFLSPEMKDISIIKAKEKFVSELKSSNLNTIVLRPTGFFVDLLEIYNLAKKGIAITIGGGLSKSNPISGIDLANIIVSIINNGTPKSNFEEHDIGGPTTYNQKELIAICQNNTKKNVRTINIPIFLVRIIKKISKMLLKPKDNGPLEFFLTVMAIDMCAPKNIGQSFDEYIKLKKTTD
jgi:uncharacterized protein YbjT (DUF2867 family)